METLDDDDEQSKKTTTDVRSEKKSKTSLPGEIIEQILTRLPVKSVLRFRSVSKPWLSLISHPSFTKQHLTQSTVNHRTALLITAHDTSTGKRYFLSAAHDGGSVTHLITLDDHAMTPEHLNGLVCFTSANGVSVYNSAFVLNPSSRKMFKFPPDSDSLANRLHTCYLFGFDESTNEHKVLKFRIRNVDSLEDFESDTVEVSIFSLSNYSWRTIDVEVPVEFSRIGLSFLIKHSVCVKSVIHFMLSYTNDIMTFDLRTEKFSKIRTPVNVVPREIMTTIMTSFDSSGDSLVKDNNPHIIKINGCVGVVCHDRVLESNGMDVWILQDYERRVWVRETITFPEPWIKLDYPFPSDSVNMRDEIIFSPSKSSRNVISVPIYNTKDKCFRSVQFTLSQPFLCSDTVEFDHIKCYVESLTPLETN